MKIMASLVLCVLAAPMLCAQGEFIFQDLVSPDVTEGGAFVGSDFTIEVYINGDPTGIRASYFGATGGQPTVDGAGLFDGGIVSLPGLPAGATVTGQIRLVSPVGWVALQGNDPFQIMLQGGEFPRNTIPSQSIVYGIPEPTTFTLLGLGSLALLVVRRRR